MEKKIGILTLNGYYNYGNRLQNYALEQVISKMGYEVETILVDRSKNVSNLERIKTLFSPKKIKKAIDRRINIKDKNITQNRKDIFMKFTRDYMHETDYKLSRDHIPENNSEEYDYFVVGSDQVWNPNNLHGTDFYFLSFAKQHQRISYAASIGVSELEEEDVLFYQEKLDKMNFISVREQSGAAIVEKLTGRKASVHVDPTMLLTKEEWLSISKRANNRPKSNYLLTYFLGGPDEETKSKLNKIAKERKLEIINLGMKSEVNTYETGPSEFIDYINHADAFFTDSFHGVVYSIVLQTPFLAYERRSKGPSMYSRIETILENFNLKEREAKNFTGDIFEMDFSETLSVLDYENEKSLNYLKKALREEE